MPMSLAYLLGMARIVRLTTVDFGVEALHPAVHHFRESGVIGHFGYRQASFFDDAVGAAGGQQFHAAIV